MIGFVLAGEEVGSGREFGIGGLRDVGEGIGIDLPVADDLFGHVRLVAERGRGWGNVGDIGIDGGSGVNRGDATGLDVVDGRFRDGVGVFPEIVLDAVLGFANLVGPDGASILEMNDVGAGGQRRQKH